MLSFFEVHNFKSLKHLRFKMREFNVLVGPNGAGKTNIVRALELFGDTLARGTTDPAREQGWDQIIRREKKPARGGITFRASVPVPPLVVRNTLHLRRPEAPTANDAEAQGVSVELSFSLRGSVDSDHVQVTKEELLLLRGQHQLRVEATETGIAVDPGTSQVLWRLAAPVASTSPKMSQNLLEHPRDVLTEYFSERSLEQETERNVLRILNWQRFFSPWMKFIRNACQVTRVRLDASALRSDSIFKENPAPDLLGPTGEGLAVAVDRLRGQSDQPRPAFLKVLTALQRVYPRIEDVRPYRIQPGRLTLLFKERGISEELGLSNISDGVLHALALLVMLEGGSRPSGLLALEEPENAIHPWSVQQMITRAQEPMHRQILLTTHSETVVNAVKSPDSLFIVENDDQGGTVVAAARTREAALETILEESEQKLGDLWMGGTLGGVPASQP